MSTRKRNIRKNSVRKSNKDKGSLERYNIFYVGMGVIFFIILGRLLYLQVVMAEDYREQANSKNYKNVAKTAARGNILDKDGSILATSKQNYVLQFSETTESKKYFFKTITRALDILDEKNIPMVDDFPIIVNSKGELEYNFKSADEANRRWLELRFKRDRGFDEAIVREQFGEDKKVSQINPEEAKVVDELLLQITPEEAFRTLEKNYDIVRYYELDLKEERKLIVIKDAIKMQSFTGYSPVVIANTLDQETAFIFEQLQPELPGIIIDTQPIRYYPEGELGSAFLGYMSKINPWEQARYEEKGYDISTDQVGSTGIEGAYEKYLKGSKGQESIQINKQGRRVKTLGQVEAYAGNTVKLNIDMDIQRAAEQALDDALKELQKLGTASNDADTTNATRGAAIAIRNTGEVLALASKPGFDPNVFTIPGKLTPELSEEYFSPNLEIKGREYIDKRGLANKSGILTDEELRTLGLDERKEILLNRIFPIDQSIEGNTTIRQDLYDIFPKPFYNYGTLSLVPPGSTFKAVTSLAGLEEGVIDKNTLINDVGQYKKNNYSGNCWIYNMYHGSHGAINVSKALEVSCNYFFYEVADRLYEKTGGDINTLDFIAEYGWKLGLGVPSGSDLAAATGIEIQENFGQVYNYESSKSTLASVYINKLVNFLEQGVSSRAGLASYKPFDIVQQKETGKGKELDQIKLTNTKKKALVDAIKEEIKKDEKSRDDENLERFTFLVEDIINTNPELSNSGYTKQDISSIAQEALYCVIDGYSDINTPANAYNASIGQGMNQFTPLQLASYVATLLNGGDRYELKLVDEIIDGETGEIIEDVEPKLISQAEFKKENIEIIKQGMKEVTGGESGTAAAILKDFPITNGGKTGTSNIIDAKKQGAVGRDAAGVYVGFAPYDNPEIIVVSIIYDGGHGKGNIAKAMFEAYFKEEILKINPSYDFKYK
ncbi:MAG: penicillin-binding transpeptidase domain-containing protein [Clostridium sp.]|uniref:penicillin-binding transpeptidase domain-containing protein n=1 Tax=Clostridium sp. TaxID=1506 RepID=UPI0030649BB2